MIYSKWVYKIFGKKSKKLEFHSSFFETYLVNFIMENLNSLID